LNELRGEIPLLGMLFGALAIYPAKPAGAKTKTLGAPGSRSKALLSLFM
jgi:hypothetical protein